MVQRSPYQLSAQKIEEDAEESSLIDHRCIPYHFYLGG